jgi:hypothetical protein
MKRALILLQILFGVTVILYGQDETPRNNSIIYYWNMFNPSHPFYHDDPNVELVIPNDSNNLWQIGKPNKPPLDTTNWPPNALMTDTVYPYPVNNHSVFELRARKPQVFPPYCWSEMILRVAFLCDVDLLKDGLYIEVSYNGSNVWTNIYDDNFADNKQSYHFSLYPFDTLFNGQWGISRIDQYSWTWYSILDVTWFWDEENNTQYLVDSVAFRFHFISDSINTNKQGFEIIDLYLDVKDFCGINVEMNNQSYCDVSPNPINNLSMIKLAKDDQYHLVLYDFSGRKILSFDFWGDEYYIGKHTFLKGIYFFDIVSSTQDHYKGSFIVN